MKRLDEEVGRDDRTRRLQEHSYLDTVSLHFSLFFFSLSSLLLTTHALVPFSLSLSISFLPTHTSHLPCLQSL